MVPPGSTMAPLCSQSASRLYSFLFNGMCVPWHGLSGFKDSQFCLWRVR